MRHWLSSPLVRRAGVFAALVLVSNAAPNAAASDNKLRETLRYDGNDFDTWRQKLQTELKPEVRIEGLKALGAFGVNGYAREASAAICDLMRGYDARTECAEDAKVVTAGLKAIEKIGGDALPQLKTALKSDKRNVRRFAVKAIGNLDKETQTATVLDVVAALDDADWYVTYRCLEILHIREKTPEIRRAIKSRAKQIVPDLDSTMKDKDHPNDDCKLEAIVMIGLCGSEGKDAVPALVETLNNPRSSSWISEIIYTLGEIGPDAKDALPVLKSSFAEYLEDPKKSGKKPRPGFFSPSVGMSGMSSGPIGTYASGRAVVDEHPLPQTVKDAVKKIEKK